MSIACNPLQSFDHIFVFLVWDKNGSEIDIDRGEMTPNSFLDEQVRDESFPDSRFQHLISFFIIDIQQDDIANKNCIDERAGIVQSVRTQRLHR